MKYVTGNLNLLPWLAIVLALLPFDLYADPKARLTRPVMELVDQDGNLVGVSGNRDDTLLDAAEEAGLYDGVYPVTYRGEQGERVTITGNPTPAIPDPNEPVDPPDPCIDPESDGCPCPDSDEVYPNCPVIVDPPTEETIDPDVLYRVLKASEEPIFDPAPETRAYPGKLIDFPFDLSKTIKNFEAANPFTIRWGYMWTLENDIDALTRDDFSVLPKATQISHSYRPNYGSYGLEVEMHGTSDTVIKRGGVHWEYAPDDVDNVQIRFANNSALAADWTKRGFCAHAGQPELGISYKHYKRDQLTAYIDYMVENFTGLDTDKNGITLHGHSMGGNCALIMSRALPDRIRKDITTVGGSIGFALFRPGASPVTSTMQLVGPDEGENAANWDAIDVTMDDGDVIRDIYYWHLSTSLDPWFNGFSPELLEYFQSSKIGHRWLWGSGTHGTPIIDVDAGKFMGQRETFDCPEADRENSTPFPAFSRASSDWASSEIVADYAGQEVPSPSMRPARGYSNLGLCWNHNEVTYSADQIDIPIRYNAYTGIGGGFQDQPDRSTVVVTPRELNGLDIEGWDWSYEGQSGTIVDGSATVTLQSSDDFGVFSVKKP